MALRANTPTGVDCSDCGLGPGSADIHGARCDSCGRFAERSNDYCVEHDVNIRNLTGYDDCPMCRERDRIKAERNEMMARRADPRMHPSVDARRF